MDRPKSSNYARLLRRWQSRGTLWTAGGALLVLGATTLPLWRPERFELNEMIIWAVSLTVMSALLVEFGSYEERVQRDLQRLAEDAVRDERMRVSRELHDGVLNTLAGVGLELENLLRLPEFKPSASQKRLREVQTSLEAEQRTLRSVVERLRTDGGKMGEPVALTTRLRQLVERVERQRSIKVEWKATDVDALPSRQADDLYFLVQEAVMNAAQHSGASTVWLEAERRDGQVTVVVSDNGRGFPFKGRYDLDHLISSRLGPTTLKERVAELGGALVVESSGQGTQVGISLKTGTPGA